MSPKNWMEIIIWKIIHKYKMKKYGEKYGLRNGYSDKTK